MLCNTRTSLCKAPTCSWGYCSVRDWQWRIFHPRLSPGRKVGLTSPFFPISLYASPILSFCSDCKQRGGKSQHVTGKAKPTPGWLHSKPVLLGAAFIIFQRRDNGGTWSMCSYVDAICDQICLAYRYHLISKHLNEYNSTLNQVIYLD